MALRLPVAWLVIPRVYCAAALFTVAMMLANARAAGQSSVGLPAAEQFVQGAGLRIRLTLRSSALRAFEDPGFTVLFENVGRTAVYLNPVVASNLYIYDSASTPVSPTLFSFADSVIPAISQSQLIRLEPRERRSFPVRPEHSPDGPDTRAAYTVTAPDAFALRGGRYTARFVYFNYPGYPARYDPRQIREIWEGRQESEPVTFAVAPGAEEKLDKTQSGALKAQLRSRERTATSAELENGGQTCELSDLPVLLSRLDTLNDGMMEALGLCGDAATFGMLRRYLASPKAAVRYRANRALRALTFTAQRFDEVAARGWQEDWDGWHKAHGGGTRAEWAVRRLRDADRQNQTNPATAAAAISYLLRLRDARWLPDIRLASTSEHYELRISAAKAVAHWHRAEGLDLLRRELHNRQLGACNSAAAALNELTGEARSFDFRVPAERQGAIATYALAR